MTRAAQDRTLVLVRHGDAASSLTGSDILRPLTDQGRQRAKAVGEWLVAQGLGADLVICSSATRTLQTCEEIAAAGETEAEVWTDRRVYEADADQLLAVVREADESAQVVVLVGHVPGLPALASLLAEGNGDRDAHEALMQGFPTAGVAVLRYSGPWARIDAADATLVAVTRP